MRTPRTNYDYTPSDNVHFTVVVSLIVGLLACLTVYMTASRGWVVYDRPEVVKEIATYTACLFGAGVSLIWFGAASV